MLVTNLLFFCGSSTVPTAEFVLVESSAFGLVYIGSKTLISLLLIRAVYTGQKETERPSFPLLQSSVATQVRIAFFPSIRRHPRLWRHRRRRRRRGA